MHLGFKHIYAQFPSNKTRCSSKYQMISSYNQIVIQINWQDMDLIPFLFTPAEDARVKQIEKE